jgi:hypothetical protein
MTASYCPQLRIADWEEPEPTDLHWLRLKKPSAEQAKTELITELVTKALAAPPQPPALITLRAGTPGSISLLLDSYVDERDPERLGGLLDRLLEPFSQADLGAWITTHGSQWVKQKRTALAAVVEAAVRTSAPGTGTLLEQIFSSIDADPLVIAVAAQRVRMLSITDSNLRQKLWHSFKKLVDRWENSPSHETDLALALPSLPYLGVSDSVPYLERMIESAPPRLANSAALGLLDWASGSAAGIQPLNDAQANTLYKSLTTRLKQEMSRSTRRTEDLSATLVWAIGAIAREQHLSDATSIVAAAFTKPKGLEDAAALRAATLLVSIHKEKALASLAKSLGGPQSKTWLRFLTTLVQTVRSR